MISIAMATYNGEKYLCEQLDSILNQTCTDFELIICDDCSQDSTVAILREYGEKDSRIQLHINEKNLGFKKNFEKAIKLCQGEYIALADQDDIWTPNHLEVLLEKLGDCCLVCSNAQFIDSDGLLLGGAVKPESVYIADKGNGQFLQLLHGNFVQGCTSLFKRELVSSLFPIPEEFKMHDYWIGLIATIKSGINYVPEKLVNYRVHSNNASEPKQVTRWMRILEYFKSEERYTERIILLQSIPSHRLSEEQQGILNTTIDFFICSQNKSNLIKRILYFKKNYSLIYSCKSRKLFLFRLIKTIFLIKSQATSG